MRCTRWYLPLVLLPFPIASPYFLWLFIFSTTLHARPCFYCIVLLSALFMTSCYWPPVPLESSLAVPWADNITTYADALASLMPELPEDLKPADVPMLDRCWCDFSGPGFFEQLNVTDWERQSVLRLKDRLELQVKAREAERPPEPEPEPEEVPSTVADDPTKTPSEGTPGNSTDGVADGAMRSKLSGIWNKVVAWPFPRKPQPSEVPPAEDPTIFIRPTPSSRWRWSRKDDYTPRVRRPIPIITTHTTTIEPTQSLLRKKYDLRPYGFAVVLDFGWEKSDSS
ncbi:uncharacterized protein B0H18DRAFT_1020958 [Fomitopsis serialis]|uniref:uncharacterized protein n=1 Tax=Fomitopsis serialis TaxID=139415 RepID=UPI0020081E9D|nr:uncharacterized protein B0H18DRAFT_1020958 [Neoantrodia serialis]KAH9921415.1 hypothetical protein B0H18DRAFT_1020958 [Neoantrodia serialis]